ncbi:hypothetical protein [Marinagarivorans algicola]|uniref:hypothetical protein n=1 Tax=Marinagarivorans algicola TaxID=1513270 RepID=UPI0006B4DAF7|nr:hypothetical protein [Marinagarivorans algicola]
MNEEIEGREFDWYAIDSEGNLGLFSTAGEGFVPDYVINNVGLHDAISDSIDSSNWGNPEVFFDYCKLGFYVFDWDLPSGPYKKKCEPSNSISNNLKLRLLELVNDNKLSINFRKFTDIKSVKDI